MSLLLLFSLVLSFGVGAQNYTVSDLKGALVGQFVKNLVWPDKTGGSELHIVVLQDDEIMNTLSVLEGMTVNNLVLRLHLAGSVTELPEADMVYLSDKLTAQLSNVLRKTRGNGTLVVTEDSPTLHNVMINILTTRADEVNKTKLAFQINKPNIAYEKIKIQPELVLYGGTELDIASLYRETDEAIQLLRKENISTTAELDSKRALIDAQNSKLANLQTEFTTLQSQLSKSQNELLKQRKELAGTTKNLEQLKSDYLQIKRQAELAKNAAQEDIQKQLQLLGELEQQVSERNQLLKSKDDEIKSKETDLSDKIAELAQVSGTLKATYSVVEEQAEVIDQQYLIIFGSAALLFVLTVSVIAVTKLYVKNQRNKNKLETTLTALRNTQEQLVESEKLASLGQLVAGIAHEINTPIGVVITSSSNVGDEAREFQNKIAQNKLTRNELSRFIEMLIQTDEIIQSSLSRCARLINNFKQVSADQIVAENREILLKDYTLEIMNTLSVLLKKSQVAWSVKGDNPKEFIDPGLLSQVLTNLVNNALNHAFKGDEQHEISIIINSGKEFNEITFTDNGAGMDEATRTKMFDPFFTTKRGAGGTGLGMNIVYNLVTAKLRGSISVASEPGEGTTIVIRLPPSEC